MASTIKLGFTGDVMIGRGIDRILPHHVSGKLYENCIKHADRYVELAEKANGVLPWNEIKEKGYSYIWGDVLHELKNGSNGLIINLETALTTSEVYDSEQGINYRSHPENVDALKIAGVSIATLANNHILDWKEDGLKETILSLKKTGIHYAGAGFDIEQTARPAVLTIPLSHRAPLKGKKVSRKVFVVVGAYGFRSAGVPSSWAASPSKFGINFVAEATKEEAALICRKIDILEKKKNANNTEEHIKIISLHWGPKWGWEIPEEWRRFAHSLIDTGVDVVIGHSSHHIKGIEVYKGKLIAYGLGDFINDFEGIVNQGYEEFRHDLCCLYLPTFDTQNGELLQLDIVPCKIKHLKVQRATNTDDIEWIRHTLCKEGYQLKTSCVISKAANGDVNLRLKWNTTVE